MTKLPITISGRVLEGKKYGRQIGFPTANLDAKLEDLEPGIYAGFAKLDQAEEKKPAAIIIDSTLSPEVYILDFNDDLYGQNMEAQILKKIRPFQKFKTEKELISQIKKDIEQIRKTLI